MWYPIVYVYTSYKPLRERRVSFLYRVEGGGSSHAALSLPSHALSSKCDIIYLSSGMKLWFLLVYSSDVRTFLLEFLKQ